MNKLHELIDRRKDEIAFEKEAKKREQEAIRRDKENYSKAVWAGILGILIGGIVGIIAGAIINLILAMIILPIISWSKYGLGSESNTNNLHVTVTIFSVIIGAILGYFFLFSSTREVKN